MATNTPYNWKVFWTCDQPSTARDARSEPAVIRPRPPRTSSQRPTGIDMEPLTSTAVVDAPTAVVVEIPRSPLIGPRSALNAYVRTPYPTVVVIESAATRRLRLLVCVVAGAEIITSSQVAS